MKAKKLIAFTLLAMLLVSTMACGGGGGEEPTRTPGITSTPEVTPTLEAGYLTHIDEANGFSVSYPEDWAPLLPETLGKAIAGFMAPRC